MTRRDDRGRFAVLADDLTGALASAANLRLAGFRTKVAWDALPDDMPAAIVVDLRSRDASDPVARVTECVRRLRDRGSFDYELRVDSTLRGRPGPALEALIQTAGIDDAVCLAIPAFPAAGRVTRDGIQRTTLNDGSTVTAPVAETVFPEARAAVVAPGRAGKGSPLSQLSAAIEAGERRFVADAEDEDDLIAIADVVAGLRGESLRIVTLSPGAWLRYGPVPARRFMVMVVSSVTPPLDEQLAALRERHGVRILTPAEADALRPAEIEEGDTLVVETNTLDSGGSPEPERSDGDIAVAATRAAVALIRRAEGAGCICHSVAASGGWTAAMMLDALGARQLSPENPVAPLCSQAAVCGGDYDGMDFYSKGGSIGGPGTLIEIVDAAWRRRG